MRDGTVLITGASAGLGARFALALAAEGRDVLLVARRADRLAALATEIRETHSVAAHVIACDLALPDAAAILFREIAARGLTVDTLINNAGFGARGTFAEIDRATQARMVDLNCRALMELCHAALPAMIARGGGSILNVASTAAFQPGPWMSVYYATKAFVLSFSEGLHEEVKGQGIHVSALCPGPTLTEFAEVADMADSDLFKRFARDPDAVVRDGLRALSANRAVAVSGTLNRVTAGAVRFLPRRIARTLAGSLQRVRRA
ncbi:MAG: SDR family oxidoreductase [Sphingomonas sp.]|jgi:hypothetical protein|uniref:SDR family NAD(P)-dependent oxidoreductase n=1 Tax=Sphingomonas sp. TaxID=28214 RepID=UPI00356A1D60